MPLEKCNTACGCVPFRQITYRNTSSLLFLKLQLSVPRCQSQIMSAEYSACSACWLTIINMVQVSKCGTFLDLLYFLPLTIRNISCCALCWFIPQFNIMTEYDVTSNTVPLVENHPPHINSVYISNYNFFKLLFCFRMPQRKCDP